MRSRSRFARQMPFFTIAMVMAAGLARPAQAAAQNVDLNGDSTAESVVNLTVLSTFPTKIQNKITNKAVGQAFTFSWPSAGPGGFSSQLAPGTTAGVGATWTWQTSQSVYSFTGNQCANDVCFTRLSDSGRRGPFGVPGRSLSSSGVTVSNASLTSSLLTFFSPPQEQFRVTSSVEQLSSGFFRYRTILETTTGNDVTFQQSSGPVGCDSTCGNNQREGGEVCDGSNLNEQTCADYGLDGTLACQEDCHGFDLSGCHPFPCGNDHREPGEACDGQDLGENSCQSIGGEGSSGTLLCRSDCHGFDLSECSDICGNGIQENGEDCDGTDLNGETCGTQGGGDGVGFSFSEFDSSTVCSGDDTCRITPNGNPNPAAAAVDDQEPPHNVLRLTTAHTGQDGSAWYRTQQPVAGGFTTTFQFRISDPSYPDRADGIAFVIQNSSLSALGIAGQGMGYWNIPYSVAIEFDTYHNGDIGDPNANHVAVQSCGTAPNNPNHSGEGNCAIGSPNASPGINLADGQAHTATITYTPPSCGECEGTITVVLDSVSVLSVPFDLASIGLAGGDTQVLGNGDHAWVGFTSATGAAFENHDILSWSFTPTVPDQGGTLACNDNCTFDLSECVDVCGNGVREGSEACDGGDLEASCSDVGQGGDVACTSTCDVDYSNCTPYYCGNGSIDTKDEQCDGEDLGDATCEGNGAGGGTLGCSPSCSLDYSGCTDYCGNGVQEDNEGHHEQCDGNDLNGFTCDDFPGGSGLLTCDSECHFNSAGCFSDGPVECSYTGTSGTATPGHPIETHCEISVHPAKEVSTQISVCGTTIPPGPTTCGGSDPGTSGTANIFVPDMDITIGSVYFTPTDVQIVDPNGDGVVQPGEQVQMFVYLVNAGASTPTNVHAVLSSPDYDLDGDGTQDHVDIDIATADYPGDPCFTGLPGGTRDCDSVGTPLTACANLTPFVVTFPAGHPADLTRRFVLAVDYEVAGQLGSSLSFQVPIVVGVTGIAVCGNGSTEFGEDCDDGNTLDGDCCSSSCRYESNVSPCADDGNVCTDDRCDGGGGCVHPNNTLPCSDGNACTENDVCSSGGCVAGPPPDCDDHRACTDDECSPATGCVHTNDDSNTCSDGNACTTSDHCGAGTCVGGAPLDCNDGNTCTNDSCSPSGGCVHAGNGTCGANPKGQGYWKRLCKGPHPSGDFYTAVDVDCVNNACTFATVSSIADICDRLDPNPSNDKCEQGEAQFMALSLNVCRGRVADAETIHSQCGTNTLVVQSRTQADQLLCSSSRNHDTCTLAQCESEEINSGKAIGATSLRVQRVSGGGLKLTWAPPYTDTEASAPRRYRVWRRASNSLPFVQIAQPTSTSYTDASAATGPNWQYEITVIW